MTTVDDDAAAAHLTFTLDGDVNMYPGTKQAHWGMGGN